MSLFELYAIFGVPLILLGLAGAAYWWDGHTRHH